VGMTSLQFDMLTDAEQDRLEAADFRGALAAEETRVLAERGWTPPSGEATTGETQGAPTMKLTDPKAIAAWCYASGQVAPVATLRRALTRLERARREATKESDRRTLALAHRHLHQRIKAHV
jgi:hypothetical protein